MDAPALAAITATHAPSLERLLRALASLGVLAQDANGRFAVTAFGATLDSRAQGPAQFATDMKADLPRWRAVARSASLRDD